MRATYIWDKKGSDPFLLVGGEGGDDEWLV